MSYPGQNTHHYGGQAPPQPPPQGYYDSRTGQYVPPPQPGYGYQQQQQPPQQQPQYASRGNYGANGYHQTGNPGGYSSQQNVYANGAGPGNANGNYGSAPNAPAPNTAPQSFGVQGMTYQYSNCTGRRKALCIGINYIGSNNALRGCINDARAVASFLEKQYGYNRDDIVILSDDQSNPRAIPTKANIIAAMQWLVSGAQTNDSLFLHYSGHGGQTKDLDGDEDDGYDEVIYPVDFQVAGHIVDDQIHDLVVRPLMPGVRLTALFDSCHSGTILDLPYIYSTKGILKEPNLAKDAGMGLLKAFGDYQRGNLVNVFSDVSGLVQRVTTGNSATEMTKRTKTSPADVILISGCKDSQTSADTQSAGVNTGASSYAFLDVLSRNPNQSYLSLLNEMRNTMMAKYTQKPQLSCCHPIDTNLRFIL